MIPEWREHMDALKRSNLRDLACLRDRPLDYRSALAWLSEAWELAERYGPAPDPDATRAAHLLELIRLRAALERARLRP